MKNYTEVDDDVCSECYTFHSAINGVHEMVSWYTQRKQLPFTIKCCVAKKDKPNQSVNGRKKIYKIPALLLQWVHKFLIKLSVEGSLADEECLCGISNISTETTSYILCRRDCSIFNVWTRYICEWSEYFKFLSQISAGWKNADDFQSNTFTSLFYFQHWIIVLSCAWVQPWCTLYNLEKDFHVSLVNSGEWSGSIYQFNLLIK